MSIGLSAIQGGLQLVSVLGSHKAAKEKAKSDKAWQEYNNKMVRINDALNQNTLTTNQNMRKERTAMQRLQLQRSEYATSAKVEVSAASTGTVGNSVNAALRDVRNNAAEQQEQLDRDGVWQDLQIQNQRMLSTFQADSAVDLRTIPTPSSASLMLGLAKVGLDNRDTISSLWSSVKSKV